MSACSTVEVKTVERKYDKAILAIEKGNFSQAEPILVEIIKENPGTRFATFSYLKLGDALLESGTTNYDNAEINYRLFLKNSPKNHLVPYVLNRLIELNYKRNVGSIFDDEYTFSRDPEHFKKIIREYQRFYLLYPESLYLQDTTKYRDLSIDALAQHEFIVGNWYFEHSLFSSAIARYVYTLKHYPGVKDQEKIVKKLILAYEKNQQPELAREMERVYNENKI